MCEEEFERLAEINRKDVLDNMLVVAIPYGDIEKCATLLNKEKSESFQAAQNAYSTALHSRKDKLLRAKAFKAFSACYADMGLEDKAFEMRKKMQELVRVGLEP